MKEKQLLGRRIKQLRAKLGLTQDSLAERVQISPKYLSNIERGKENPTLETLLRLARSFKVEPWEVFLVDTVLIDNKEIKTRIERLLEQTDNDEQLRLAFRLVQAALH